jgi:GNAT superfamily N-acetyltransferase
VNTDREVRSLSGPAGLDITLRRCGVEDADALCDWCDVNLAGDYFFRRGHMRGMCAQPTRGVWAVEVRGEMAGFLIIYPGSRLHNLYLAPPFRSRGIGVRLLDHFKPATVRAKTNMQAGDPVAFYEKAGYDVVGQDQRLPHILEMRRREPETMQQPTAHGKPIAQDAPGSTPSQPASPQVTHSIAQQPSRKIDLMNQAAHVAASVREQPDEVIAALVEQAQLYAAWQQRQRDARIRRVEKERANDAEAAAQHLNGVSDPLAKARAARAAALRLFVAPAAHTQPANQGPAPGAPD